eukprot:NODE_4007_length_707_cov_38.533435_g3388_i0.p2 GENE.NODE_4007_length_707_cov_38.533435_g3388_i0~~NODE_4007_length_707_cov_38.533435_g3388_i0.p2  ORF type:complete len:96 (+),score=17.67 NODE_4007_length_707_cov_38.533435_g3388_i0:256-543(+)
MTATPSSPRSPTGWPAPSSPRARVPQDAKVLTPTSASASSTSYAAGIQSTSVSRSFPDIATMHYSSLGSRAGPRSPEHSEPPAHVRASKSPVRKP